MSKAIDFDQVYIMRRCLAAFVDFNEELVSISPMSLGAEDVIIKIDGLEDYVRLYYHNGEPRAEPIFNPIRDVEDL